MGQAKLIKCKQKDDGIELFFKDENGNEFSRIYNNGNLNLDQLTKMVGQKIGFSETEKGINVNKAWDGETPTYCDDSRHGFDR